MKRGWKISLIALGSAVGLLLAAVAVLLYLVFTPSRLTSIANRLAKDYIECEARFGRVSLSLFKTWPNAGLRLEDVVLVNPCPTAPGSDLFAVAPASDTLAGVESLAVGLDLRAFLKDGSVIVRQLCLENGFANLYTSADGWSNLDVFARSEDTDTSSSGQFPERIDLRRICVRNLSARCCDLRQGLAARADCLGFTLCGGWEQQSANGRLRLSLDRLRAVKTDTAGARLLDADLSHLALSLRGSGPMDSLQGRLRLSLDNGALSLSGKPYITDPARASRKKLLSLNIPFRADLQNRAAALSQAVVSLLGYSLSLNGALSLPHDGVPLTTDMTYAAADWQIAELLSFLPADLAKALNGFNADGRLSLSGKVVGSVGSGRLPVVDAHILLHRGSLDLASLPSLPLHKIEAEVAARLNLSADSLPSAPSDLQVLRLSAQSGGSSLSVTGRVDDFLSARQVNARIRGNVALDDLAAFLPPDLRLRGASAVDLKVQSRLSDLTSLALERVKAHGTLLLDDLDVQTDSLHASSPHLRVALALPAKRAAAKPSSDILSAHITGANLNVEAAPNLEAEMNAPDIVVSCPNLLDKRQPLSARIALRCSRLSAQKDSLFSAFTDTLRLKGSVCRSPKEEDNLLRQWNPVASIDLDRLALSAPGMTDAVRLTSFIFDFRPEVCSIREADVLWGVSDYHLSGQVRGLQQWLSHTGMLTGSLDFGSHYADIDQLMAILSGMGADKDTLEQQRAADNISPAANPFIVPKDVDLKLNTHIDRCVAFGNDLADLSGSVSLSDGTAVLDQMGFTCKAARMQLTGLYRSPRINHLFLGLDFHLLDIQIEDLLDMIPTIDTLVPMLASFRGKGDFHLAAECNLDAFYRPKMSTLLGAAAITGSDLVVMDNDKLASIARLLQLKDWRQRDGLIGIDSLSVEAAVFRKEIEVFPFLLDLNKYRLCVGGRHTLDNACNYHLELLKCPLPVRLAVDVNGTLAKPNIKLGSVKYAELYKPEKRDALQTRTLAIKQMVREALEANVR